MKKKINIIEELDIRQQIRKKKEERIEERDNRIDIQNRRIEELYIRYRRLDQIRLDLIEEEEKEDKE